MYTNEVTEMSSSEKAELKKVRSFENLFFEVDLYEFWMKMNDQ